MNDNTVKETAAEAAGTRKKRTAPAEAGKAASAPEKSAKTAKRAHADAAPQKAEAVKKARAPRRKKAARTGPVKILFAAYEAAPFIKTGGLGDVAGSLPGAIAGIGGDIRVIMPKFSGIPEQYRAQMTHVTDFTVELGWRRQYCGIETLTLNGLVCYFIDNEFYFARESPYGYGDDGERVAFFSKAVLESLSRIPGFFPDILHLNDWHTALAAPLLRSWQFAGRPGYDAVRTVFTVHNLKFQGRFNGMCIGDLLGLSHEEAASLGLVYGDDVNFMRGALSMADRLTVVSPSYAEEVCTDFYGENTQDIYRSRRGVLSGILNGIDPALYDPATDEALPFRYSAADPGNKKAVKAALQREIGLNADPDAPLAVVVSRLTEQKGLDLILCVLGEILESGIQLAVLGIGEERYENAFRLAALGSGGRMSAMITFSDPLSRRFYGGADMALVPSLFEPCGLSQMIAMRYGALPVVRETGGLRDSVRPYNRYTGEGTGFSFANFNAHELLATMREAARLFREEKEVWKSLTAQAMAADFSWKTSAEAYMRLYNELLASSN